MQNRVSVEAARIKTATITYILYCFVFASFYGECSRFLTPSKLEEQ